MLGRIKKLGVWVNYGGNKVEEAIFQESDQTLRVTEPMINQVKTINKKTLQIDTKYGGLVTYYKIEPKK